MTDEHASRWREYADVHGSSQSVVGRLVVWPTLESPQLGGAREIVVYLPPSLGATWRDGDTAGERRYPVLYFNDGQNVFDEKTAYVGVEWQADETLEALAKDGTEAIAVAIPNGLKQRMDEYNPWHGSVPWKVLPAWADRREMGGKGDAYLSFVADTVKPLIDQSFPTAPGRATTGMVGSSMGGLITAYAVAAKPSVFGLAGAFSPSLPWSNYRILDALRDQPPRGARIYVDIGWREGRGMTASTRKLRKTLLDLGFVEGVDLMYVEDRAGIHRETAWARRLPDAIRFLLRPTTD